MLRTTTSLQTVNRHNRLLFHRHRRRRRQLYFLTDLLLLSIILTTSDLRLLRLAVCAPKVMDVNLRSIFFTCKAALPYLAAAGRSSIVNISSIQAARGFSGYPGYAATKAGIEGFSRQIAVDYASQGIRVNCVVRTRFCLFI